MQPCVNSVGMGGCIVVTGKHCCVTIDQCVTHVLIPLYVGQLLSVAPWVARLFRGLFSVNERVVLSGEWEYGSFTFTAVGAFSVGSIDMKVDKVNVHVCVVCAYVHVCIHVHAHMCMWYMCNSVREYMCACMFAILCVCVHVYILMCVCACV